MTKPAKVIQHPAAQQGSEQISESNQAKQGSYYHGDCSWFIRYHVDGSWSVGGNSEAANDPDMHRS